jgi:hypothetical protein
MHRDIGCTALELLEPAQQEILSRLRAIRSRIAPNRVTYSRS